MTDPLAPLRRRLERFELEHLRAHAAELAARIEALLDENDRLRDERDRAWETGNAWHERFFELCNAVEARDPVVGITVEGEIGVVE